MSGRNRRGAHVPLFFIGLTASSLGMWMVRFAQSLVALEIEGGGASAVGITVMLQFIPALVLGLGIGTLADRIGPTRLLLVGQLAMTATAAAEMMLAWTGRLDVTWCYLTAMLFGVGSAVDHPLRLTSLPALVSSESLHRAVSGSMFVNQVTRMAGPALGAAVVTIGGNAGLFAASAACLAVFVPILAVIARSVPAQSAESSGGIREGLTYLRSRRDLMIVCAAMSVGGLLGGSLPTIAVLMAGDELGLSTWEIGVANAVIAAGTISGVLVSSRLAATSIPIILASVVAMGLSGLGIAAAAGANMLYVTLAVAGLFALVMVTLGSACVQFTVDPRYRSRVTSVFSMSLIVGSPVAAPILGFFTDAADARVAVAAVSAAVVLVTGVLWVLWSRRRHGDASATSATSDETPPRAIDERL